VFKRPTVQGLLAVYRRVIPSAGTGGIDPSVVKSARRYVRRLEAVGRAAEAGQEVERKRLVRDLVRSRDAGVWGVIQAGSHLDMQFSFGQALALAADVRPDREVDEPVHAFNVSKRPDKVRVGYAFGLLRQAQQYQVRALLSVQLAPSAYDYSTRGKGVTRAVRSLADRINQEGATYVVIADIKDCYQSFTESEVVKRLPLPEAVTRATVLLPESAVLSFSKNLSSLTQVRLPGLPPGSLLSNMVASALLKGSFDSFHAEFGGEGYADDFQGALYTTKDREEAIQHLKLVGDLRIAHVEPGEPFDYLGYEFPWDDDLKVAPIPKSDHWERLPALIQDSLDGVPTGLLDDAALDAAWSWDRRFPAYDPRAGLPDLAWSRAERIALDVVHQEVARRSAASAISNEADLAL